MAKSTWEKYINGATDANGQKLGMTGIDTKLKRYLNGREVVLVDYIKGLCPAIAIEQKVNTTNARSTVGTSTEIYDYLKLLYARIGKTYSPISGKEVKRDSVTDLINEVKTLEIDSKWLLLAPIHLEKGRKLEDKLSSLLKIGFSRILVDNEMVRLDQLESKSLTKKEVLLIIDRIVIQNEEDFYNRLADAVQTAFYEGKGVCYLQEVTTNKRITYSNNNFNAFYFKLI
jgi:excinuclease ABC subunit A